jgi:AraC-like DNA-binding protein
MGVQAQPSLPQLGFGQRCATLDRSVEAMSRRVNDAARWSVDYRLRSHETPYYSASHALEFNGLTLGVSANTGLVDCHVSDASSATILIPLSGGNRTWMEGKEYAWNADQSIVLMPAAGRFGQSGTRSVLFAEIQPQRLQHVLGAMLGQDAPARINLEAPRQMAMTVAGVSYARLFRNYCRLIDLVLDQPAMLARSHLDDVFYRLVAQLLAPGLFFEQSLRREPATARALRRVCAYIESHLGDKLCLSDLETISGVSARSLQYAFLESHGCTPMRWIREQRLQAAHLRLLRAEGQTSVTEVALACGFCNLGNFSGLYLSRFGESPSLTLALAQAR